MKILAMKDLTYSQDWRAANPSWKSLMAFDSGLMFMIIFLYRTRFKSMNCQVINMMHCKDTCHPDVISSYR